MAEKVSFNPITKIIQVTEAPTQEQLLLDMSSDIYGSAKRQWLATESLTKFAFPFVTIGGQPVGEVFVGAYFFLRTDLGWRIRAYDEDHELTITGNLYPFVNGQRLFSTVAGRTIPIAFERSVLSQKVETSSDLPEVLQWLHADQELSPIAAIRRDKDTKEEIWRKNVSGGNLLSTIELTEPP